MTVTTVACRTCHSGWYGSETDVCKGKGRVFLRDGERVVCSGSVVVTDSFRAIDVRRSA